MGRLSAASHSEGFYRPVAATPQEEADARNANLKRTDIEWFVTHNGDVMLRDKPEFTRWNTEAIDRRHERERQEWMRRNA